MPCLLLLLLLPPFILLIGHSVFITTHPSPSPLKSFGPSLKAKKSPCIGRMNQLKTPSTPLPFFPLTFGRGRSYIERDLYWRAWNIFLQLLQAVLLGCIRTVAKETRDVFFPFVFVTQSRSGGCHIPGTGAGAMEELRPQIDRVNCWNIIPVLFGMHFWVRQSCGGGLGEGGLGVERGEKESDILA